MQACWLVKSGVPFNLAFGCEIKYLSHEERAAMAIVLSQFEGAKYNWNTMRFEKRDGE